MKIDRFEFDDPDDPKTSDGKIRLTFAPEAMVIALPNGKDLGRDDQLALGQLLRVAYEQGKAVGAAIANAQLTSPTPTGIRKENDNGLDRRS